VTNIGPALHLGFALTMLWGLLFFCWREYRWDALRERLFALRFRLFLCAAKGEIAFDTRAYRTERDLINGMIRFAHKLTSTRLLLTVISQRFSPDKRWIEPMEQWRAEVAKLPSEPRKELMAIHDEMFRVVMRHMATGNLVLFLAFVMFKTIRTTVQIVSGGTKQNLSVLQAGKQLHLNLIEAQALEAQQLETAYGELGLAKS
jgi:hypothetical protein